MKGVTSWYIRIGEWAFNLFLLNILWLFFSLLGLFVLGIFPATVALFAVIRKLIMSTENVSMFKLFWNTFKVEFFKSNLLGFIFLVIGFVLYIDLRVLQQLETNFFNLCLTIITYIVGFLYLLTLLHVFPIFVHFNLKTREYIKYAFVLSIGRPIQSLLMIIALGIMIILLIKVPGLIPIFGISLTSFIIMKISFISFPKVNPTPK
ncbi:YesL family protein [Metabacillus herbersteinensis]|uniref:YesL family protein n=1 Tax=Metabacillus herbersteinensis TaxID=283816 RepID=A0ABV6GGH0_9BACI